jgi:WD40 repeat protein
MKNTNWSVSKPTSQIIDLHTGQIIKLNTASEIRFNHTATFAAWINKKYLTIYEMNSGRQRVLPVPDNQETAFAWSPDDRYIAYLGEVNPFTSWSDTKDIRVIDLQTGKSATLIDGITMRGIHNYLLWLP